MTWAAIVLAFVAGLGIGAAVAGHRALLMLSQILSTLERLDQIDQDITREWWGR